MGVVSVEHVSKRFRSVTAVDDLSFEVRAGEVFALLGPNGAGKTTTVRMLLGMIRPDAGRIHWRLDGQVRELGPREFGYLPEDRGLYRDQPVLRTLTYFGVLRGMSHDEAAGQARAWLARFDLAGRAHEKLEALSKGNQQKVQFAAALLHRPRVALLDEPFSGLDPVNQELVLEIIGELRDAGTTVVLSAHQMNLVERIADRVLLVAGGRAVIHGSLAELRQTAAGTRLVIETAPDADVGGVLQAGGVADARLEAGRLTLLLHREADLNAVLATVAARLPIRSLHSEAISLHDIYVRAVRHGGGADTAPGAEEAR